MNKLFFYLIILLICTGLSQNNEYVYMRQNQKVIISLSNGKNYVEWDEEVVLKIKSENVNPRRLSFSAPGLKLLDGADDKNHISTWTITPRRDLIKGDTLKLWTMGTDSNDNSWKHKFNIPIK